MIVLPGTPRLYQQCHEMLVYPAATSAHRNTISDYAIKPNAAGKGEGKGEAQVVLQGAAEGARPGRRPTAGVREIEAQLRQTREALRQLETLLTHQGPTSPAAAARLARHLQHLRDRARRVHAGVQRATS